MQLKFGGLRKISLTKDASKTKSMDIWASKNKKNIFKGNFFLSYNSEEIWTTDMVTGPVSSDIFGGRFLSVRLKPSNEDFEYEQ